jgi:hypothetical protein
MQMPGRPAASPQTLDSDIVFVFGALRSGTSLFKLMLNAHRLIANPGEMDFLFDHLRPDPAHPSGWRYDRDALALDRLFIDSGLTQRDDLDGLDLLADLLAQLAASAPGRILAINLHRNALRLRRILPRARILHLIRDPRDVARSSIGMGWAGTVFHGVGHWIATETSWDRAMAEAPPGPVLTLKYETLLGDLEGSLRRVCDFLGVAYDPAMCDYHRNSTYAPPDASLVEQWRRFLTGREIALIEGRAGALMRTRGYQRIGPGLCPGWPDRLRLGIANRIVVWRFRVRRFGLKTVLVEKFTRQMGLRDANRRVLLRMHATTRRHLR